MRANQAPQLRIQMQVPLELGHLIKTSHLLGEPKLPNPNSGHPHSLTASLQLIETRKNLEVEHYLRACALRLSQPNEPGPCEPCDPSGIRHRDHGAEPGGV